MLVSSRMQNYLKDATRDTRGAVWSIVIGVVFMLFYVLMILLANLAFKQTLDRWIDKSPVLTLGGLVLSALVIFMIGIGGIFRGVKLLDSYTPKKGTAIATAEVLSRELLAYNATNYPFQITQKGNLLTAEWKLADAKWYALFGKAGLSEKYTLYLKLNQRTKTVLAIEYLRLLEWNARLPVAGAWWHFTYGWNAFNVEWKRVYGIKEINPFTIGKVCGYSYNINTVRIPLLNIVMKNGWSFKPAVLGLTLGI